MGVAITALAFESRIGIDRALYAGKNIWKAMVLASLTPQACHIALQFMETGGLDVDSAHAVAKQGIIYATLDAAGAVILRTNLSRTNVLHHAAVLWITAACIEDPIAFVTGPWAGFAWYGAISCLAWPVNAFLGARLLMQRGRWPLRLFAAFAGAVYAACCALNWLWQARVFMPHYTMVQNALMAAVVFDDVVLMKFLFDSALARKKHNE